MTAEMAAKKSGSSQAFTEVTPLHSSSAAAGKHQTYVLGGLCVAYVFCILPVGLGSGLLPALEEDSKLNWSPTTSGIYTGISMWAVGFGALTIGWLPDYLPNTLVLMMYLLVAGVMLHGMSMASSVPAFILMHGLVFMMKSVTWPAAMSILGTRLVNFKAELGILFVGLFSRMSSVASSVLIGSLLIHVQWRTALEVIATICICAVVIFRLVIKVCGMDYLLEKPSAPAARSLAEASSEAGSELAGGPVQQQRSSCSDIGAYVAGLFSDGTFLLLIVYAMGLELSLGLPLFFSNFMHSIFNTTVAEGSIYSGVMNMGEVLSLVLGIALVMMGVKRSALFHIILVQLSIGVLVTATIIFVTVDLRVFFFLGTVLGFATTLGGYLIVPLHCIVMAKEKSLSDIATRVTVVDGLAMLVGATSRFFVGRQRDVDENEGLHLAAILACIGTLAMALSLFALSRSSPEGTAAGGLLHSD